MKLLFNIFSTVSFLGMAGIVGGGIYVYVNKDAIIDNVKEIAIEQVKESLPELLSGALGGGGLPGADMPSVGGGTTNLPGWDDPDQPDQSVPGGIPGF